MNTQHTVSSESSVMFNLRQLMELEAERLSSEAEAARAAALAAEQRRADAVRAAEQERIAEERAAVERARQAQVESERVEREREAALLRVRLEAEANARIALEKLSIERERLALEHARAGQATTGRRWLRVATSAASLTLALLAGGALHAALFAPPPAAARGEAGVPSTSAASAPPLDARPLEALTATPPVQRTPETPRAAERKPPRGPARFHGIRKHREPANELDDIDLGGDDPVGDL